MKIKIIENNKWRLKSFWRQWKLFLCAKEEGEDERKIKWEPGDIVFQLDPINYYLDCPRIIPMECKRGKTSWGVCIPYEDSKIMINLPVFRWLYYLDCHEENICETIIHEYVHRSINEEVKTNNELQNLIRKDEDEYIEFNEKITSFMANPDFEDFALKFNLIEID